MAEVTPFMRRSFAYFSGQGYSPQAAAALAGHAQWESSGSPTITDPRGEGSIGLYQWRLDRRQGLNDFAKARGLDPRSEDTQLAFANWELQNTERRSGDALRSAQDLDQANAAVMGYLRPAGWTAENPQAGHAWANRLALSQAVLGDDAPTPTPTSAPAPTQLAQASDQSPAIPTPASAPASAEAPSIWSSLQRSGARLFDLGSDQDSTPAPAPRMAQAQIHRGQPVSLLDLVFANPRKRVIG